MFSSKDDSELLNDSQFMSPFKSKKGQKRQKIAPGKIGEEEDISKLIGIYRTDAKKKKEETAVNSKETRQKLLKVLGHQLDARFEQYNFILYCKTILFQNL